MLLFINTIEQDRSEIALIGEKKIIKTSFKVNRDLSENLLPEIESFFKKNQKDFSDISKIAIVTGAGSYTGVRVGVSTANALAYALKIPIFQVDSSIMEEKNLLSLYLKKGKIGQIRPIYGGKPNITKPKKK